MTAQVKKTKPIKLLILVILGLGGLGFMISMLVNGSDIALFNPRGQIAEEQLSLMLYAVLVMLVIAVPAIFFLYYFAWRYRESNQKVKYRPNEISGKSFIVALWLFPTLIVLVIAFKMWPATHRLAPQTSIASENSSITIQVVALRWKWLFVYPEQNIASVNFVQIPVDTPVKFELTADETPMSSFWIPNLGGQLYAMTGHSNQLNLMADYEGDYPGKTAEINGFGFSGMTFTARVSSQEDFESWIQQVKLSDQMLDQKSYDILKVPSENNAQVYYSTVMGDLYDNVLMRYYGPKGEHNGHNLELDHK